MNNTIYYSMNFRQFLESQNPDLEATLKKLPKKIQSLLKGYKYTFTDGNSLKNDKNHIGIIDKDKKTITIAAPYFYGRETIVLHEIAHLVWEKLNKKEKEDWYKTIKKYPSKAKEKQNNEEHFCMAFSATYSRNPVSIYDIPQWVSFIKSLNIL